MMNDVLDRTIQDGWNCIDIGAHIGSVSYTFSRLSPRGKHIAFEPSTKKAAWLSKRLTGFDVYNMALSNETGQVSFYERDDKPGYSSLDRPDDSVRARHVEIECRKLDDVTPPGRKIDLIKIDVEGHEYKVLLGAQETIRSHKPFIIFEAGPHKKNRAQNESYIKLYNFLTNELDYELYSVFDYYYERPCISEKTFISYRTYPFLAFNFIARPIGGKA